MGVGAGQAQPGDQVLPGGADGGGRVLHRDPRGHAALLLPRRLQNVPGVGQAAAHPQDQVQGENIIDITVVWGYRDTLASGIIGKSVTKIFSTIL